MTILQALDRYYGRMAARGEAEAPGYSCERISFVIVLSPDGDPVDVVDLREQSGKRLVARLLEVPAAVPRRVNIVANTFWDKTEYCLGRSAEEDKKTSLRLAAFKKRHLALLAGSQDEGLIALSKFIDRWKPAMFDMAPFAPDMLDTNIIFRLDGDSIYLHKREAAHHLLAAVDEVVGTDFCLVTGIPAPVRRLHPTVKGVQGAQTAGATLVSFNLDAFTSYGKEQGANAPVSEMAAFRYGAALNRMLDRDSPNRVRRTIGDATVVFWAEASGEDAAAAAESFFADLIDPPFDAEPKLDPETDEQATVKLHDQLEKIAAGRPGEADPRLRPDTRFHVLGLAPNAARLSVRYWLEDDFSHFARRLLEHARDLAIEPPPRGWGHKQPSVSRLLVMTTALREDFKNIPNQLAGEVMRAILNGTPYPRTLLATAVIRLRAGDEPWKGWHAAVIKACLNRPLERERDDARRKELEPSVLKRIERETLPVALDPDHDSSAYQLGRLFAVLESAQYAALGQVNAPIGDRYYGAASSTPARVFGALLRGLKTYVSDARKRGKGGWIEPRVTAILARLPPDLPKTLRVEDQGKFAVGYYHERSTRPSKGGEADRSDEGEQA